MDEDVQYKYQKGLNKGNYLAVFPSEEGCSAGPALHLAAGCLLDGARPRNNHSMAAHRMVCHHLQQTLHSQINPFLITRAGDHVSSAGNVPRIAPLFSAHDVLAGGCPKQIGL